MTGLMPASAPLAGEAGGGEVGGKNGLGSSNTNNTNGLLGTTSREAFQKIVSSHTSTQVVYSCTSNRSKSRRLTGYWFFLTWIATSLEDRAP